MLVNKLPSPTKKEAVTEPSTLNSFCNLRLPLNSYVYPDDTEPVLKLISFVGDMIICEFSQLLFVNI